MEEEKFRVDFSLRLIHFCNENDIDINEYDLFVLNKAMKPADLISKWILLFKNFISYGYFKKTKNKNSKSVTVLSELQILFSEYFSKYLVVISELENSEIDYYISDILLFIQSNKQFNLLTLEIPTSINEALVLFKLKG